jgi:hypothetical protein
MVETFYTTMHHFFPQFLNWLGAVKDPRVKKKIKYPFQNLAYVGILLFLLKLGSRRQVKYRFSTPEFIKNLNILSETEMERVADPGTLENLLKQVNPEDMGRVRTKIVNNLIRKKVLAKFRLFGQYYMIAIDGTGHLVFKERHCRHCLTKKKKGKILYYYHPVLDAKLVTENGLSLSIATEFIENTDGMKKQDCEINACKRLVKKLKRVFPQLKICLLLDSLYAGKPVFDMCKEYGWKYIITFKEGSMKEVYREYLSLKNSLCKEDTVHYKDGKITQDYNWVTDIDYEGHKLNVLELNETKPGKKKRLTTTRFVWLTNFVPDKRNHVSLAEGGRMRWKIENEGYNTQKNGGYNMEHAYSCDETAMKNYYFLLQIAHIINQLMEKGSLIAEQIKKVFGSIRNVARQLLEDLRTRLLDKGELTAILSQSFQIRLDSS